MICDNGVDLLMLNILTGAKTTFLTPLRYDSTALYGSPAAITLSHIESLS